jgi:formylglycine-generating enzyme required for sulfatase activity
MMVGLDVMIPSRAPALSEHEPAMVTAAHSVPCDRCGRIVRVALNSLRPPSFHDVDEQIECPEIQEARSRGNSGLLLMMCRSLKQSLDARCDGAAVEVAAPDDGVAGQVVCSIPGMSTARYSAIEARSRAEIWQAHGYDKLANRLRAAAAAAEREPLVWTRAATSLGALLLAVAVGWFMLTREPAAVSPPPPAPPQPQPAEASSSVASVETLPRAVPTPVVSAATDPALASSQDTSSKAAPSSRSAEAEPSDAPEPQAAPASAATTADDAPAADSSAAPAPADGPKVRLPDIVMIPGGTFVMSGAENSELPAHRVSIKPFALGRYPVMVGEWKACVTDKACADVTAGPDDNPVTNVSYDDAKDYLAWLSRMVGKPFRLPSEAEWEYAARAGATTKFWWGNDMRSGMANCSGCNETAARLMKVGSFPENPFGLFDMGGCVDQWVADSWHKNYQGAPLDGSAWIDEQSFVHVIRSGSWKNDASYVRSGSRDRYDGRVRYPTHGFRVALSL